MAIDRAIELKSQYNIRVMNLSLGRGVYESYTLDPLCQAVERAWQAGIVVVVSAGNLGRTTANGLDGYATITSPGIDPSVITVGALVHKKTKRRTDYFLASFSSKGPTAIDHIVKPDIVAPGNLVGAPMAVNSELQERLPGNVIPASKYVKTNAYMTLSGTSMATPMIAGAAALLISKEPGITPDTVKARLYADGH